MKFSMTRSVKVVMLGAGGTGGHIYPGLAVADEIKKAQSAPPEAAAGCTLLAKR